MCFWCRKKTNRIDIQESQGEPQVARVQSASQMTRKKTLGLSAPERKLSKKAIIRSAVGVEPAQEAISAATIRKSVAKKMTKGGKSYGINILMRQTSEKSNKMEIKENYAFEQRVAQNTPMAPQTSFTHKPENNDESWFDEENEGKEDSLKLKEETKRLSIIPRIKMNWPNKKQFSTDSVIKNIGERNCDLNKEMASFNDIYELDELSIPDHTGSDSKEAMESIPRKREISGFNRSAIPLKICTKINTRAKSFSPANSTIKNLGYRTLKYNDLLSLSQINKSQGEDINVSRANGNSKDLAQGLGQSGFLHEKFISRGSGSQLGTFNMSQNSGSSILINDADGFNEISKTEYFSLDFSVQKSSMDGSALLKSKVAQKKDQLQKNSIIGSTQMPSEIKDAGKDKERVNKDLDTTYIRSSEMVNARKSSQVVGFVVTGKRTKINQYVLVSTIGKGGWGEVFWAVDVNTKDKYVSYSSSRQ